MIGYGYKPIGLRGRDDPATMHQLMASTPHAAIGEIKAFQNAARKRAARLQNGRPGR